MSADPRITKMAEVLVDYSVAIKKGERAIVVFGFPAIPLLREVYRLLIQRGALEVILRPTDEDLSEIFFKYSSKEQRTALPKLYEHLVHNVEVFMILSAPRNTRYLTGVDGAKQTEFYKTIRPIVNHRVDHTRWVLTQFPTDALAMDAEMSLGDYEEFLFSSINDVDWAAKTKENKKLADLMNKTKEVRIVGEDTDLSFSIAGRHAEHSTGNFNMPDSEVFTSVVEDSTEGHIRYTYPAIHYGIAVPDVRLEFKGGKVVTATAGRNEAELNKILDGDEGARRIGEFGVGTNYAIQKFTSNILFDEKIGGSIHLALGEGYSETLSKNESSIHWDMVKDLRQGGELYFDDKLVQKDGKFLIDLT